MNIPVLNIASMLVLIITRPKCTLASSHADPGTVIQTKKTPERYITLSAMESAVLLIYCFQICNPAGRRAQMSADN